MTDTADRYTLYGAPASLYTGKARSYLRTQGIAFVEDAAGKRPVPEPRRAGGRSLDHPVHGDSRRHDHPRRC